jgi:acyl-coenzyme A thioesterase PaaI-like protein
MVGWCCRAGRVVFVDQVVRLRQINDRSRAVGVQAATSPPDRTRLEEAVISTDEPELSIQERLYPDLPCFGCGHANPKGLRLRSYPDAGYATTGLVTAAFTPWPEHDNGLGYLNGGIIGTVLDCHSAAAVVLEAENRQWPALVDGAALPYVTAGLDIRYRRPSPLHDTVELQANVVQADESEMTVDVRLVWDGKTRAQATAHWKRWRPR